MARHNVFRDGNVHVMAEMCATCIFRPGNPMHLRRGRVKGMVEVCLREQSAIICHSTLDGDSSVCRGFYDRYDTLRLARALEVVVFDA